MPWQSKLNTNPIFIELTYSGNVTAEELNEALESAISLSKQNNTSHFLADCTTMLGGHSIIDLYNLISHFEKSGLRRPMREAIILPTLPSTTDNIEFYETAAFNRGFNIKLFSARDKAIAWLTS